MVEGACKCGSVRFTSAGPAWGIFVCHCSQCPSSDRTYMDAVLGAGAAWVALPRVMLQAVGTDADEQALEVVTSSSFAQRARCRLCGSALWIRYASEAHTDWVHLDSLAGSGNTAGACAGAPLCHIHCEGVGAGENGSSGSRRGADGRRAFAKFEPWEPDPCRPEGALQPAVCGVCWLPPGMPPGQPAGRKEGQAVAGGQARAQCNCAVLPAEAAGAGKRRELYAGPDATAQRPWF